MRFPRNLCLLLLIAAVQSGFLYAAPKPPIVLACPVSILATGLNNGFSTDTKLKGDEWWSEKIFAKGGINAFQARRNQGTNSDLLWCDYRGASDENSAVWMQMSAVTQAPADHPKCTVGADQKSFSCRALASGETY